MRFLTMIALGSWCLAQTGEAAEDTPLAATREAVAQWVQTRQLISRTRSDWDRDRELLEQTRALHERELKTIEDRLSGFSTNSTQVDKDLAKTRADLEGSEAALKRVKERTSAYEARVRELLPRLPAPLRQQAEPLIQRLPKDAAAAEKATAAERLQTLVGLLNEIDKFNSAVTVVSEVQKSPSGAEVQVETIYLGLAQAWFVDVAGDYAGVGIPGPDGWQWQPRAALASLIRRAIDTYRESAPPAFLPLPVTLQ